MPLTAVADAAAPGAALRAALARPLRPAAIAAAATAVGRGGAHSTAPFTVEAVLETGSTNADLLARARTEAPAQPLLRTALSQTAGRGRHGRRWHAAPGSALLFSLAVPLGRQMTVSAVPLAAGVALAEALGEALGEHGVDVRLKWPNDLLLGAAPGHKLGGVLAELAIDGTGSRTLVVGVGVNLWLDAPARDAISQPAAALADCVPLPLLSERREALIGATAAALLAAVRDCVARGFVPFQPRFMQRFALLGQPVEILDAGTRVAAGRALGVDGDGRLLVEADGRVTAFTSGEVSLRARTSLRAGAIR